MSQISPEDLVLLAAAAQQLERQGLAGKLAAAIGTPIEMLLHRLPGSVQTQIDSVSEEALRKALAVAVSTMRQKPADAPWKLTHKLAATLTGVTGGMFGMPALFAELPVTTVIMLRSIAEIARSHGEDLADPEVRLACLEVFALGSGGKYAPQEAIEMATGEVREHKSKGQQARDKEAPSKEAPSKEEFVRATYFVARAAMAQQVTAAAEALSKGAAAGGSTAVTRLIHQIASRFGVAVSEKAAAQAVPIIGAIGGGLVNALFMNHFQDTAEAHFTVRRLERRYGHKVVRAEYERLMPEKE